MCEDGPGWRFIEPAGYRSVRAAIVSNGNMLWGGLNSSDGDQVAGLHGGGGSFVEQRVPGLKALQAK